MPAASSAVVDSFIAHINAMDLEAAFALLHDDVVYHNIPMQPVVGRDQVRAVFGQLPAAEMEWIVHNSAVDAAGNTVLNERTDRFRFTDGRRVEIRVMGVFEVVDGRITAWRDYFDLGQWMAQMAPPA